MKELLQKTLWHEIPLTRAMGLQVEEASSGLVRLRFPLEPNHNHKMTAFGGSLYSAAVLAGWGVAWCALRERGVAAQVVVAGSVERFVKGVSGDFMAECDSDPGIWGDALRVLQRKGRARVVLESRVLCGGDVCVDFQGTYGLIGP